MKSLLLAAACLAAALPSLAQDAPTWKIGGLLFADYTYQQEPATTDLDGRRIHASAFNVTRAYLNVTGTLNKYVGFRITPDIARESGGGSSLSGSQELRLKYAWAQLNLDSWIGKGSWARFGLQTTPFIDYEETIYRYRFQGPVMVDREGLMSAADSGVAAHYAFPGDRGDLHAGIYNGETFARAETNDQKSVQLRATWRPLPASPLFKGLRVTGYVNADAYEQDAERNRAIGQVTFEHPRVNAGLDYVTARDQQRRGLREVDRDGWSAWVTPKLGRGWEALLRHDDIDSGSGVRRRRDIEGVAWWMPVPKGTSAAVMVDRDSTKGTARDTRYGIKLLLAF